MSFGLETTTDTGKKVISSASFPMRIKDTRIITTGGFNGYVDYSMSSARVGDKVAIVTMSYVESMDEIYHPATSHNSRVDNNCMYRGDVVENGKVRVYGGVTRDLNTPHVYFTRRSRDFKIILYGAR